MGEACEIALLELAGRELAIKTLGDFMMFLLNGG